MLLPEKYQKSQTKIGIITIKLVHSILKGKRPSPPRQAGSLRKFPGFPKL